MRWKLLIGWTKFNTNFSVWFISLFIECVKSFVQMNANLGQINSTASWIGLDFDSKCKRALRTNATDSFERILCFGLIAIPLYDFYQIINFARFICKSSWNSSREHTISIGKILKGCKFICTIGQSNAIVYIMNPLMWLPFAVNVMLRFLSILKIK